MRALHLNTSKWVRLCAALLVLGALSPGAADAQNKRRKTPKSTTVPCDHLKGDDAARYNQLGQEAVEHFIAKAYSDAINSTIQLRDLCDEDPRVDFNLARAYQKGGDCHMARYWYESILRGGDTFNVLTDQPEAAANAVAKLEKECQDSTRLQVECETEKTSIELTALNDPESKKTLSCPFEGRLDAGQYSVRAEAVGHRAIVLETTVSPEDSNRIVIPALQFVGEEQGKLEVICPRAITWFEVLDRDGSSLQPQPCPGSIQLAAGPYAVVMPHHDPTPVEVLAGETIQFQLLSSDVAPHEGFGMHGWGWLAVGAGVTFLATSIGLHVLASDMQQDILSAETDANGTVISLTERSAVDVEDRAQSLNTVAIVGDVLGGAALITGVVLLLLPEPAPVIIDSEASSEHFMIRVQGTF